MSSSIDALFGNVDKSNLDANVSKLFSSSNGPIDDIKVKTKKRTVISEPAAKEEDLPKAEEQELGPAKKKSKKSQQEETEIEDRYYAKLTGEDVPKQDVDDGDDDASDDSGEQIEQKTGENAKRIDLKENELEKAERTVFVGNLPSDVITSKKSYKEFKKLFSTSLDNSPGSEESKENSLSIDSIRFRSISFDEALPRKVAFVQQKLHKSRDSVNAYIVYKNKSSVKRVCQKLNGQVFMSHHLRVDSVTHPAPHENKRSVFVGNLDFEEDDESLWSHFQPCGEIEYVRVVRDSKTNLGKGFAYIQFKDFQSVNKALLLNDKPMISVKPKGGKRKLRVSRCKNIKKTNPAPGSKSSDSKLNESHRTKYGRAKKVLGKADRATLGQELTVEGLRATKGDGPSASHLKKKKQRSKTGRVTKRSLAFKKSQAPL